MHRTCWLTWLLAAIVVVSSSKLNVPRVLLPISPKTPVNYTLEVSDGGCYTWSSSRPEAVKVIPLPVDDDQSCSRKAVVTATGSSSHKTSAIVLAQAQNTDEILRCDVIVNQIHTLQIAMKTRELFIEDAPEEFYARASDDQGNEFSSVDGLVFRWSFEGHSTDAESSNEPVLRWVKFADSSYDVIPSIAALESQGQQGHVVLIEGLRTGSARVSVQLESESFKKVPAVTVNIVVVANLVLDPPELYLMPGSVADLRLSQIRQGRAESIPFPSSQYYLEIDDSKVGSVIETSGSVMALERGTTNIRLRDRNMKDPDTSHAPYVTVHVVHPNRIGLAILPDRMWAIVSHVDHAIQVEFFDEDNNLIQPPDDLALRVQVPQAFRVKSSSDNQTYHLGQGVEMGMFKIKATLRTLKMADGSDLELTPPLKAMADLEIFQSVTVTPKQQVLIWDPIMQPRYKIKYSAAGGSDSFQFGSTNTSLTTIAQTGVAQIYGLGTAKITASIPKYPHIRGESELYVLPALDMRIVPHIVEIDEGNKLYVPVSMTTRLPSGEETTFDDCRQVRLFIELSDKKNFETPPDMTNSPKIRGCSSIEVNAKGVSVTKLSLTLNVDGVNTKDSIMLASYRPLKPLEPLSGETVLALGSSRVVVFEGGPLPWVNKPSGHYRKVVVGDAAIATIGDPEPVVSSKFPHKDVFQVLVTCRSVGETDVVYQIGNIASSTNTHPIQTATHVKVHCVLPKRISLTAEVRMPDNSKIPCDLDSVTQRLAAQSYLDLNLLVVVKDEAGRKLDNFSSLAIEWTLSKPDMAQLSHPNGVLLETRNEDGYVTIGRSNQMLKPAGRTGPLDVTAKITGYKPEVLKLLGLDSQPALVSPKVEDQEDEGDGDEDDLTDTVDLILVDDASIDPGKDSLFNHQDNKLVLRLSQGSGNFHVDYQPPDVARVIYNTIEKTITIIPVSNGELKIVVTDLCLWARSPAVADVSVVGLSRIELEISDKIEQGSSVPMKVHIFDTLGNALDASVLPYVNLQPVLGSSIVRIKAMDDVMQTVEGVALGETTIAYEAGEIRSSVVNVQVFAPLKLSPRNVTLVIGATLQVVSTGGPQPDAVVEYSLDNGPVATCTRDGMVSGMKLGHSKLLARAVGIDRQTGKMRVYSQDQVNVHVVSLSGIRITLPLKRVRQNSEIPVYVMGLDAHQTPFSFGTCIPRLNFEWSLSDNQSGQLMSAFHRSGLDPSPSSSHFSIRFKALQPGHTLLRIRVTATEPNTGQLTKNMKELVDEVSIHVYEALQLTSPYSSSEDVLVMMPNAVLSVRTNLDSSATVNYVTEGSSGIVDLDGKGSISSGSLLGQTSLMITAKNNYGVTQTIGSLVEVRSVSYMMLTAAPILNVPTSGRLSVVPRGFDFELRLSYHDSLGRNFHAVRSQLAFRPSRLDLLRISVDLDNCSITLHADKVGQTVLHFHDEAHPGLVDYLRVDVADVIRPSQSELVIGDVVCFSTPILPLTGSTGRWSADSKLLHIDAESGVAMAVAAGTSEVSYSISPQHTTSTGVSIGGMTFLEFYTEGADKLVTNGRSASHVFPLTLHPNRGGSLIGENCSTESVARFVRQRTVPFTCRISFSADQEIKVEEVFTVQAEFDVHSGFYRCTVTAVAAPTATNSVIDANLIVRAYYSNEVAARLSVPFHPGVFVQTPELHVSDLQATTQLVIVGKSAVLQHLEFSSNDDSALTLYSPQQQSPTNIRVPVRLNSGYFNGQTALHVSVHCPLSGQRIMIPVHVKIFGDEMQCTAREATWLGVLTSLLHFSQEWALSLLSLLGTAAAIYIGYRALFGPGYRTTSDPVVFLPPNARTAEQAFSSPFVKRGPQLWSVDSHDSPVFHPTFHQRSPTNVSPTMRQQQHQSPF